jgi:hypothetical protein
VRRLEQIERIAVGIFQLDLLAARTDLKRHRLPELALIRALEDVSLAETR